MLQRRWPIVMQFSVVLVLALMCGVAAFHRAHKENAPGKTGKQGKRVQVLLTTQSASRSDQKGSESAVPVPQTQRACTMSASEPVPCVAVRTCDIADKPLRRPMNAPLGAPMIRPIFATGSVQPETADDTTTTSLETVEVLAAEQRLEETSGKSPEDCASVRLPACRARPRLATRAGTRRTCRHRWAVCKIASGFRQQRHGSSSTLCTPVGARFRSPPLLTHAASRLNRTQTAVRCSRKSPAATGSSRHRCCGRSCTRA